MQLSYTHGSSATPLLGDTVGLALDLAARRFGARDALISCHQNLRYSYSQLLDEVNRAARALIALGLGETEAALSGLEAACAARLPGTLIAGDPFFSELAGERRYRELMARLQLPLQV